MSPGVNVRASRRRALTGKWSGGSESRLFEAQAVPAELRQEHNAPSDIFPARREFTEGDIVSAQGRALLGRAVGRPGRIRRRIFLVCAIAIVHATFILYFPGHWTLRPVLDFFEHVTRPGHRVLDID